MHERHEQAIDRAPLVVICSAAGELAVFLRHLLASDGLRVALAATKEDALSKIVEQKALLALIDCDLDGALALCRAVRNTEASSNCRILGLIGQNLSATYPSFLSAGMDDALMRPVEPKAILDAVRRLTGQAASGNQPVITHDDIKIDLRARRVWRGSREIMLTRIEFELLVILAKKPMAVHSRQALIAGAWPRGVYVEPRTVTIHVGRLRRRLMGDAGRDLIRTIRGSGYALEQNMSEELKE